MKPSRRSHRTLAIVATSIALLAGTGAAVAHGDPSSESKRPSGPKPTVVLVHGVFADASGFSAVIERLQRAGYPVVAPANPLRDLPADAAYISSVIDSITGPVILAGHSYGGAVITNAARGHANVKALVYLGAFALDEGETPLGIATRFPGSELGAALDVKQYPLGDGKYGHDGYIKADKFRAVFAADLPASQTRVMAAAQRPGSVEGLSGGSGAPAWKTLPSWYLIPRGDKVIPPDAQRFMARRANSTVQEIDSSHVVMMSHPDAVYRVIVGAARATG
ncbi:alpha/beta fold hydrolase [Embleya sp. NPDC055664]|uniref:alpha/beta fold hydrolase n=1 Tax=Embleya sp. NPDC059237 TaxID=3346784 RepID=UPI003680CAAC